MHLPGSDLPLGDHILPAPHHFSASTVRGVELFSLTLIPKINHAAWPAYAELALLLVYPFACLLLCTLFGLLVRKISQKTVADLLFSPPSLSLASR